MTTTATFSVLASRLVRQSAKRSNVTFMLGLSSAASGTMVTLCEDKDDGVVDKLQKMIAKDGDGKMDWNSTMDQMAKSMGAKAQSVIETGVPTQISYGFVSGYCSGYALKKVGKVGAMVFGLGFMTLQTLSYSGYIEVDHVRLQKEVTDLMDLNKDGKVDTEDGKHAMEKLTEVFSYNLPAGSGFGAGFVGGLRSG